jgi:hypothetical protein
LAVIVVPSSGSSAISILGPSSLRRADPLADVEHRRLVALALADHHRSVERELVELGAHRLDRGGVGGIVVAAADPVRRGDRRGFGHPDHFQHEDPVEDMRCLDAVAVHVARNLLIRRKRA